jgi:hypothetical protein
MKSKLKTPIRQLKVSLVFIVFVFLSASAFAQSDSISYKGRGSFYAQFMGPEVAGIHVNIFLSNLVSLNFGAGFNLDAHVGLNCYPLNRTRSASAVFVGVQACTIQKFTFDFSSNTRQFVVYVPVGYEFIGKKGLSLQFDIGPNFAQYNWSQNNTMGFNASLRIGISTKQH